MMSDVKIPFGDSNKETAILLLAAAESLGRHQYEVRTGVGHFVVDSEIADEAGLGEKPKKAATPKESPKKAVKKSSPKKKK